MKTEFSIETIDLQFLDRLHAIASFLITGPEGSILIETGPESCRERLVSELVKRNIAPEELAAVFVTHIHLDHAGAAGWFASHGVPLYVHPKGEKHLVDPTRLVESARMVYGERFDSLWGEMTPAPAENVHIILDGETVEVSGISVTALDTPGHAFHHHAFQLGNTVFAGDSSGARIDESGYVSLTSAPPQFHLEHTLASIRKLKSTNCRQLFLTHFGEVSDPASHCENYAEVVELNAEFVRQRLLEGMDEDSLRIAYQAFQMEQAFRFSAPRKTWNTLQQINGTDMCADGIRMYWQRKWDEDRS